MLKNDLQSLSLHQRTDGAMCLRLVGEWRMPQLVLLQRAAGLLEGEAYASSNATASALERGPQTFQTIPSWLESGGLVVDLTGATYLDSTIFGALAGIALRYSDQFNNDPILQVRQGFVWQTVRTLSFDQLFDVKQCELDDECLWSPRDVTCLFSWSSGASTDMQSCSTSGKAVLEAHQALSQLSAQNRKIFCPVLDALSQELTAEVDCKVK